jgi:hypothetical protein
MAAEAYNVRRIQIANEYTGYPSFLRHTVNKINIVTMLGWLMNI